MQTSKARNGPSLEVPQWTSPKSNRGTKSSGGGGDADSSSSSKHTTPTKTPTNASPRGVERRSPRSPVKTEKKRPSKLSELEARETQLQEDLKKIKDQLSSSESSKKQAQQETEDLKSQLQSMTAKLEDAQNQLMEFSAAEEARLQELREISQDRDRAWQSELEAIQKQHSLDIEALSGAMNEIHWLKLQLEKAQAEMAEKNLTVEKLNSEVNDIEKTEAEAEAKVVETQQQLEVANATIETLRCEGSKLLELFRYSISELEESKAKVRSLDVQLNVGNSSTLELEVEQLKLALEAAEAKYEEEQTRISSQITSAYDIADQVKIESGVRESELESLLKNASSEITELKAILLDKENELQAISEMNHDLKKSLQNTHLNRMEPDTAVSNKLMELKANLMDKETELQSISEENELLKQELSRKEMENGKNYESAITEMELAKAKEKEAMMKLEFVAEEGNKRSEQLEAAKVMNSEMEAELRRLRVQSDQWRKAAEAAAAVLTTGNNNNNNNGRFVERTGSLDADYQSIAGKLMNSPFSDDLEDDSPKKKNSGVLRKLGLWKKNAK